jgi:hypothetical protein
MSPGLFESILLNQYRRTIYSQAIFLQRGKNLVCGYAFIVKSDFDSIFLRYFMFDDSRCCLEDGTYPLAQASGAATGNIQLHNSLRSVNSLHKETGQQQEDNKGDEAIFWEFHG